MPRVKSVILIVGLLTLVACHACPEPNPARSLMPGEAVHPQGAHEHDEVPIMYGLPAVGAWEDELSRGELVLGGCVKRPDSMAIVCLTHRVWRGKGPCCGRWNRLPDHFGSVPKWRKSKTSVLTSDTTGRP